MTCDMTCPEDCENECPPLSARPETSRSIERAVNILAYIDNNIDENVDLENVPLTVNAEWLAGICSSLLDYAAVYEDVNIDELFEFESIVTSTPKVAVGTTKH